MRQGAYLRKCGCMLTPNNGLTADGIISALELKDIWQFTASDGTMIWLDSTTRYGPICYYVQQGNRTREYRSRRQFLYDVVKQHSNWIEEW